MATRCWSPGVQTSAVPRVCPVRTGGPFEQDLYAYFWGNRLVRQVGANTRLTVKGARDFQHHGDEPADGSHILQVIMFTLSDPFLNYLLQSLGGDACHRVTVVRAEILFNVSPAFVLHGMLEGIHLVLPNNEHRLALPILCDG
jgi:hypothetical protein